MKSLKKVFCLVLAMAALICTVGNSVYAEESITVSSVTFLSDGEPIRFLPGTGDAVSASVTGTGAPTLILAAFDKDGKLLEAKTNTSGLSVGSVSVTDGTEKIRLFVWNGFSDLTPVTSEDYSLKKGGILQSFSVSGGEVQILGSEINVTVPVWDANGDALNTYTVKAKTLENTGTVTVGDETFSANTEKDIALKSGSVTVREGEKTENYKLNLNYRIYDDFDDNSVFHNITLTGSTTAKGAWTSSSETETELIPSETAKSYITYGWDNDASTYSDGVSIGVLSAAEAQYKSKQIDQGSTNASGNAIRIGKTKNGGSDESYPWLKLNNSAFKGASQVVIEYDTAFTYDRVTEGNRGSRYGGIKYFGNGNYGISDCWNNGDYTATNDTEAWGLAVHEGDPGTGDNRKWLDCNPGTWHHIKTVIDVTNQTCTQYANGVQKGTANYDVSGLWTGDDLAIFQTSGKRCADIWVDNLSVTWNSLPALESMTVDGKGAQIDNANNIVTVNIPLWDSEGNAVDAASCPAVLTASEDIKVGDTAVVSGTQTALDFSTAQKITVGERIYDMIINRTIYDDFDDNSVFNAITLTGSTTAKGAWTSSSETETELIPSEAAKSYMTYGWDNDASAYSDGVSIGVLSVTEAQYKSKQIDQGSTNASGNAIRIGKTKNGGSDESYPWLKLNNSAFKDASQVVIEYDIACAYGRVTEGNCGTRYGGIKYFGNGNYGISDCSNTGGGEGGVWGLAVHEGDPGTGDNRKWLGCDPGAWHHIKTVIDVNKKTCTQYANGVQKGTANYDVSGLWTGDDLVIFQTSGKRCADIWLDNLSVTYTASTTK